MPPPINYWTVGCVYGASAVALGAFGAHGLKTRVSDVAQLKNWETAAHYQLVHSLAVLLAAHNPVAAGLFTAGMTLFSGSIYTMVLAGPSRVRDQGWGKVLGPATPIGGLCLIAGWVILATRGRVAL